jgi:hypothetical protein
LGGKLNQYRPIGFQWLAIALYSAGFLIALQWKSNKEGGLSFRQRIFKVLNAYIFCLISWPSWPIFKGIDLKSRCSGNKASQPLGLDPMGA